MKKYKIMLAILVAAFGLILMISHLYEEEESVNTVEQTTISNQGNLEDISTTTTSTTITTKKVVKTTKKTTKKASYKFTSTATASKAEYMAYAKQKGGYNDTQMQCLDWLWTRESDWNPNAVNKSSGACGIPQAYPCTIAKYYGSNTWEHQIMWGVDYICNRYNCNPCKAWNHFKNHNPHWY